MTEEGMLVRTYQVQNLPEYRRPIVEKLIECGVFDYEDETGYDELACQIFDTIIETHALDAHLRANLQPENHD